MLKKLDLGANTTHFSHLLETFFPYFARLFRLFAHRCSQSESEAHGVPARSAMSRN